MSGHVIVKARTAAAHAGVDAAFSRFDLGRRDSYVGFLKAHGRVVPAIEAALTHRHLARTLPDWRARSGCLMRDLAAFGHGLPAPLGVTSTASAAELFGLLYVIEGSRLGGRVLLRRIAPGFSAHYLSAVHEPGEWRALTRALDRRAAAEDARWLEGVVAGALHGFALYAAAAEEALY